MEAAIVERLRRSNDFKLHQKLENAPLIYNQSGKRAMVNLYQKYVDIANKHDLPLLILTPTWRANRSRVESSNIDKTINIDAANFLIEFRNAQGSDKNKIKIGGLIGCKNDCYLPDEGLSAVEAELFHQWQIEQLVLGNVDYLIAETLPNVEEALGIAKAMATTDLPYIISFVISKEGCILDGTNLNDAIKYIDANTSNNPLGYMINCAFPSFLCADKQPKDIFKRLIGYQANASSLDHCDLEGADNIAVNAVAEWGDIMIKLNHKYGIKILGGCCGTDGRHLQYIAENK